MNLFRKINLLGWYAGQQVKHGVKRLFNLSLTDPKSWDISLWNLRGSQSLSGETVTEETALTYSAVWNAHTLISGTVSTLPLHLMQKAGKLKHIADDRSLYRVMHDRWNPYMTAMAGREVMMGHILSWGNGYAEKVINGYGEIVELWPIPPNRVTPKMENSKLVYEIRMDGVPDITLSRDQILHIPGLGFDGFVGYSVISMARKSIGLGMAMETFGSHYFGQGTHPGVIVSHPGQLNPESHKNLKTSLTESYSGLGQSHRLMLLEDNMKIEKIGIPPEDSQFLESRQFQITDIARWYNIPVHKLKEMTKSSFNNIESEQLSYYGDCILLWLVRLEQNYNMQLLSPREQKERLYFKHAVQGILRADAKSRGEFYSKMFNIGAFSVNDIRELEDMNPVEGGDVHLVPLNMTTLENAGKQSESKQLPEPKEVIPTEENKLRLLTNKT